MDTQAYYYIDNNNQLLLRDLLQNCCRYGNNFCTLWFQHEYISASSIWRIL